MHPIEAKLIRDLGIDFLVDYERTRLLLRSFDPGYRANFAAQVRNATDLATLLDGLRLAGRAAALLATEAGLRRALTDALDLLPEAPAALPALAPDIAVWSDRLAALFMAREGDRSYTFTHPFDVQVTPDGETLLRLLAFARQALLKIGGDPEIPLAAALMPRAEIPPRGPAGERAGVVEIVEAGDLLDPFSRQAHQRIPEELAGLADHIRWRWVHFPTLRTLPDSRRAAAIAEAVAQQDPAAFWPTIDRLYEAGAAGRIYRVADALEGTGIDPVTIEARLQDESLCQGIDYDRQVALACGAPYLRSLMTIGRRMFIGTDQAAPIRQEIERLLAQPR